ncbi:hypothetical protein HMPREF2533_04693 [Bacteroides fragilis]|nr:hypothetical protein M127_4552 [Bacteroides fragilis str. S6L5]KXU39939.1 hypothetical protein HMPREF2533_04693 [Bacteroides fragilis]KXU39995.1 hypothetical protein HMPREF2530_04693 [Bacteroides fragilis]
MSFLFVTFLYMWQAKFAKLSDLTKSFLIYLWGFVKRELFYCNFVLWSKQIVYILFRYGL